MVTTPTQQDGASNSSPTDPPSQPEQQPTVADDSNQLSQPPPEDPTVEPAPPIHPAPLPEELPVTPSDANWKRPPPRLMIKIYKVPVGALVSWHALLTPNHEEIAKYQLYSYQECTQPPSTSLWKKLGDIDPLPLPMACTLSRFSGGSTYHFAIRAVDVHGRCGKFSESLSMYMEEDKVAEELLMADEAAMGTTESQENSYDEDYPSDQMEEAVIKIKQEKVSDDESEEYPRDTVTPVNQVEKMEEYINESENAVAQGKEEVIEAAKAEEQNVEIAPTKEHKEQEAEMVQVKEEKDCSPNSC